MRTTKFQDGTNSGSRWRRVAAVALVASSTLIAVDAPPVSAGPVCSAAVESGAESGFVSQLNALRGSRGLPSVVSNGALADPARGWSATMSSQDELHHARDVSSSDGVEPHQDYVHQIGLAVPDWTRVAENVGVVTLRSCDHTAAAVASLHGAFVNSSGHFKNMIGDFNQVGVGVYVDSNQLWVTVRFAKGTAPKAQPSYTNAQLDQAGRYVDAAYRLFLDRPASTADIQHWSKVVASGNRGAFTRALAVSDEWSGTRVSALYQTVLGRLAEATGRAGWVNAISRGMQLETVAAGIYGSPERFIASGGTNAGYVNGLYRDILGREADAGGRNHWVALLDRGAMNRTQVASGFYGSLESRRDRVTTLYGEILGRAPDATGFGYWTDRLSSLGDVVLASTLATSTEFWQRSTR